MICEDIPNSHRLSNKKGARLEERSRLVGVNDLDLLPDEDVSQDWQVHREKVWERALPEHVTRW